MSSKTAQTVRSDTVAHWTGGKDIEADFSNRAKPEYYRNRKAWRKRYLERLRGTLLSSQKSGGKAGLWMKRKPTECLEPAEGTEGQWWYTCFTEVKPEESSSHIKRYGRLGFVFNREFVLGHYGVPVTYIPGIKEMGMAPKGKEHIISRHAQKILDHCYAGMESAKKQKGKSSKEFRSLADSIVTIGIFLKKLAIRSERRLYHLVGMGVKRNE